MNKENYICEMCGEYVMNMIPAYVNGKKVCERCFFKIKRKNKGVNRVWKRKTKLYF